MDGPQLTTSQVASYKDGSTPLIEETNSIITEVVTTRNKRESNFVHHGWSGGAVATLSPWMSSRIHATNRHNPVGTWITRRTLAQRLTARVLAEDLVPAPEFKTAIEEALSHSTRFEKFQAVYCVLNRWGDVIPLEIELGISLSLTDTEANFAQFPAATSYNSLTNASKTKTANIIQKGAANSVGCEDGMWTTTDVPSSQWKLIRVTAVVPTLNLLSTDTRTRLSDLHDELLAYVPPLTIDIVHSECTIHDDMVNAAKTISQVGIRYGHHIVALSVTYLDGVTSGDGGDVGMAGTFTLTEGEHIAEIMTCASDEWLHAIQFITNKGRCSAIYGWFQGTPTVSRSEGGVLAGFSMRTKKHPQHGYMVTEANGIWRHDLIPRTPKESDVYSDYFGAKNQHGQGFNDRALIGNSSSIHITCVEVRAHGEIHSIEFTYTDTRNGKNRKFKAPRHGGSHGPYYRFDLGEGEHIVSVTGKYNDNWLTHLCFGTNLGRTSEVYGGGGGESFSARAPLGENGKSMRLQYVLGRCGLGLNGVMFAWTPDLP
ncbi:unnamed protein product [Rhizoctonia solani]|uniref:Jacalin-type lectin domain-containing protein n=1 Tax=Rhizoctonia solani TaxID=456999 RepID=A0A8H3CA69_9AGAM|nr:unnamed protein product [Rhizoctonia solani]